MGRRGQSITLSLSPDEKARLEAIALSVGAKWGEEPNISELVRMLATGRVVVHLPGTPITQSDREYFQEQISALKAAISNLERL